VIILNRLAYTSSNVFQPAIVQIKILFMNLHRYAFLLIKTYDIFHYQSCYYKFVSCKNQLGKRILKRLAFDVFSETQLKYETWVKT